MRKMASKVRPVVGWLLTSVISVTSSVRAASDDPNDYSLDANQPLRLEDARATDQGKVIAQFASPYEHQHDGRDELTLLTTLRWGFVENFDVQVQVPAIMGDADHAGSGDVNMNVQWDFLREDEHPSLPEMSVEVSLIAPTGERSAGLDMQVQWLATKTLTRGTTYDKVHADLSWLRNSAHRSDEREGRYLAIVGYSRRLTPDLVLVTDLLREQLAGRGEEANLVEAGLLVRITDDVTFQVGAGVGFGDESPSVTADAGVSWEF